MGEEIGENSKATLEFEESESEFSSLYKYSSKNANYSQQERREFLLKEQKEKRHNIVDSNRDLTEIFSEEQMVANDEISEKIDDMEIDVRRHNKPLRKFLLMKSEWFCEVPDDLEENWLVKFVPEGFRILVIAKKFSTIGYSQKGKVLTLKTHLPGGGLDRTSGMTVLDCIYNKRHKTIFVLDCLFWNTMSFLDSETSFRFYWIKNKFDENPIFSESNKDHNFQVLDFFPAQKPLIQDKIFQIISIQNQPVLYDGVVFYHKELHYIFGETPLLGWLFSYMLPEKLGIDVLPENIAKRPKDYECLEKYLKELEEKKRQRKSWWKIREEKRKMDTS